MKALFYYIVFSLFWLNIIDAVVTAYLVDYGIVTEVNPIMNYLISKSIWLFLFVKFFIGGGAILLMNKGSANLIFRLIVLTCFLIYSAIIVNHLYIIHTFFQLIKSSGCHFQ